MSEKASPILNGKDRLVSISLDETLSLRGDLDQEHECNTAIYDLMESNSFAVDGYDGGPYDLRLGLIDHKLCFEIRSKEGAPVVTHYLSLSPFRRFIRDYGALCDSYYDAIKMATPSRIEVLDMGRRSIHNDAAELLCERLKGKVSIDRDTARRLFTLIYVLHRRS